MRQAGEEGRVTLAGVAGRLGSLTRECRRASAALNTLFFLSGDELGQQISTASAATTFYRQSQLPTAAAWLPAGIDPGSVREYGEVVLSAQSRSEWFCSLRIPGSREYLAALDVAVRAALDGTAAEDALAAAADAWREITAARGLEAQQQAYMRSIGRQP